MHFLWLILESFNKVKEVLTGGKKHTWTGVETESSTVAAKESPEDVVCVKI